MPLNIPLPKPRGDSLLEGYNAGSEALYRLIQGRTAQQHADIEKQLAPSQIQLAQSQALKAKVEAMVAQREQELLAKYMPQIQGGMGQQANLPQQSDLQQPNMSGGASPMGGQPEQPNSEQGGMSGGASPMGGQPEQPNSEQGGMSGAPTAQPPQDTQQQPEIPQSSSGQRHTPAQRYQRVGMIHGLMKNRFGPVELKEIDGTMFAFSPFDPQPIPLAKGVSTLDKKIIDISGKALGDWNERLTTLNTEIEPIMESIGDDLGSPVMRQIQTNPIMRGWDAAYFKSQGTSEQQALMSKFDLNINNLRQKMLSGFKGAARQWENDIVSNAKIGSNDTLASKMAKYESMAMLNKLEKDRLHVASDLVRQGVPSADALEKASKAIKYEDVKKDIQHKMELIKNAQQEVPTKLPIFKNAEEFRSWYAMLTPRARQAAIPLISQAQKGGAQ